MESTDEHQNHSKRTWAGSCLLLILTVAVFCPIADFDFITYDDPQYIISNPFVTSGLSANGLRWAFTSDLGGQWMPLTWLSHMLDCQIFGLEAGRHHLVNLAIHALNAVLLFACLTRLTRRADLSWVAAAFFAIHPQRVETVAWAAERKDVLSMFFFLLALLAYLHHVTSPTRKSMALVLLAYGLGLMCKQSIVMTPVLFLILDFWPIQRHELTQSGGIRSCIIEKIPMIALTSFVIGLKLWIAMRTHAITSTATLPLSDQMANVPISYVTYIRQFLWPSDLSIFHIHPYGTYTTLWLVTCILSLIFITLFGFAFRSRWPWLLAGWTWYFVALLPASGIIQAGLQGRADRYLYLPSIGLLLLCVWSAERLLTWMRTPTRWKYFLVVACLTCSGVAARAYVIQWRDSLTLYRHALHVDPDNDFAHSALGAVYTHLGAVDLALHHFSEAVRIRPGAPDYQRDLMLIRERIQQKKTTRSGS